MIHSIQGIITFKTSETVGIETSGLEWAVDTTAHTLSQLPSIGTEVRVWTYLYHKEDQMRLYGFARREERELFLQLLTVSGIGPSLARKLLSGTTPQGFQTALENEDLTTLSRLPGLGKKTAQKVILQLRGRLASEEKILQESGGAKDMVDSLTAMGFDAKAAAKAVKTLWENPEMALLKGEEREKEILRRAIVALSS